MKTFPIFKKSNKFYWSNDKIVFSLLGLCFLTYFIAFKIIKTENETFEKVLMFGVLGSFFLGLFLKSFRIFKPDPLRGKLEGFITLELNTITADERVFKMDEIKKIWITNDDYYGKAKGSGRNFNSNLSNGVDNIIEITLNDGNTFKYYYELYNSYDIQKARPELVNYYRLGKIESKNLLNILGVDKLEDIIEFTLSQN